MLRNIISCILILLIIVFCIFSQHSLQNSVDDIDAYLTEIDFEIKNDNFIQAMKLYKETERLWIEKEKSLALFVSHDLLEDIGISIGKFEPLIEQENKTLCLYQKAEISVMLIHLRDVNSLLYKNFI